MKNTPPFPRSWPSPRTSAGSARVDSPTITATAMALRLYRKPPKRLAIVDLLEDTDFENFSPRPNSRRHYTREVSPSPATTDTSLLSHLLLGSIAQAIP